MFPFGCRPVAVVVVVVGLRPSLGLVFGRDSQPLSFRWHPTVDDFSSRNKCDQKTVKSTKVKKAIDIVVLLEQIGIHGGKEGYHMHL
jgi:hypothetical protein